MRLVQCMVTHCMAGLDVSYIHSTCIHLTHMLHALAPAFQMHVSEIARLAAEFLTNQSLYYHIRNSRTRLPHDKGTLLQSEMANLFILEHSIDIHTYVRTSLETFKHPY